MKWAKPDSFTRRFGMEVTMYVYIATHKDANVSKKSSKPKAIQSLQQKEKDHENA